MTHGPEPGDRPGDADDHDDEDARTALSDAVEDALAPAKHDAVMAVWQQVVLGRLDRDRPRSEDEEILRRFYEGERPERPEDPPD